MSSRSKSSKSNKKVLNCSQTADALGSKRSRKGDQDAENEQLTSTNIDYSNENVHTRKRNKNLSSLSSSSPSSHFVIVENEQKKRGRLDAEEREQFKQLETTFVEDLVRRSFEAVAPADRWRIEPHLVESYDDANHISLSAKRHYDMRVQAIRRNKLMNLGGVASSSSSSSSSITTISEEEFNAHFYESMHERAKAHLHSEWRRIRREHFASLLPQDEARHLKLNHHNVKSTEIYQAAREQSLYAALLHLRSIDDEHATALDAIDYDPRTTFREQFDVPGLRSDHSTLHSKAGQKLDAFVQVAQLLFFLEQLSDTLHLTVTPATSFVPVVAQFSKSEALSVTSALRRLLGFQQKKNPHDGQYSLTPVADFARMMRRFRDTITQHPRTGNLQQDTKRITDLKKELEQLLPNRVLPDELKDVAAFRTWVNELSSTKKRTKKAKKTAQREQNDVRYARHDPTHLVELLETLVQPMHTDEDAAEPSLDNLKEALKLLSRHKFLTLFVLMQDVAHEEAIDV